MSKTSKYNRIKVELIEAGKQGMELAKYVGVHPSTVSDWCTNTNQPSIQDLYKIAEFLKVNVRKLLVPTQWEGQKLPQAAEEEPVFNKKTPKKSPVKKAPTSRKKK